MLSLLVHLGLFLYFEAAQLRRAPAPEVVEIDFTAPEELTPPPEDNSESRKSPRKKNDQQIVEQKKQLNDEVDEKTRFLSAFNQKVIRQTRAETSGRFQNTAQGGVPEEGTKDGDPNSESAIQPPENTPQDTPTRKTSDRGTFPDLKSLRPKFALVPGPKAPQMDVNGDPSQTDDYLKDVKPGLQTLLSTREFIYYAYYSRIKESLRQHWEPTVREKVKIIYRQGRTIASAKDRVTQVLVTLDAKGELIRVDVLTQSGVQDLDAAAVEAFRDAAPFPNPPKGMVESDGTVKIRWDFVLEA